MAEENQFKVTAIESLMRDIGALTGGIFETWAYHLMRFVAPYTEWDHRGTTTVGAPVGRTVDSAGDNARFVAEYSSTRDYFDGRKPVGDLDSTLLKHPHVEHIWLLAAVPATPAERTATDNAITAWCALHPGILVTLLDSRQIATLIVENLDSDELVAALQERLPTLSRIADENAFGHSLPERGPYVSRPEIEDKANRCLGDHRYVILAGHSGVGKSDMAVQLAASLNVESRIWIDGTSLRRPEELRSVNSPRRGLQHNVEFMLKNRRCVVILDNLQSAWSSDRLAGIVGPNARLIITTQISGDRDDVVTVGNADQATAKAMLELGVATPCPEEVFQIVWEATNGNPLLLRLLGNFVQENRGDWIVARECCETVISHGEDEDHDKVCRRVLKQHLPALKDELSCFLWCDSPLIDSELLRVCTSPLAAGNLGKRHLLSATTARTIRLHDIVFKSAKLEVQLSPETVDRYRGKLDRVIRENSSAFSEVLEQLSRRHTDLMLREFERKPGFEVVYAIARARVGLDVIPAFGDIVQKARIIRDRGTASEIEVRAIVEAIEATYSLLAEFGSTQEARRRLSGLMEAFELLSSMTLPTDVAHHLRHHRAKMRTRLEQWEDAEKEFEALLREDPTRAGTKLQLARVLWRNKKPAAIILAKELVERDTLNVPSTIRVAAWTDLARMDPEFVKHSIYEIVDALTIQVSDTAAAYRLVAQVGSMLAYSNPDGALALFDRVKGGEPVFASDRERFGWARTQVVAAKALMDKRSSREADILALLQRAKSTYESTHSEKFAEFDANQYAENLILLGDFQSAKHVLENMVLGKRSEFWSFWYARAELELGRLETALEAIDTALTRLHDQKYIATFLKLRFDIRSRRGDSDAIEDLRKAALAAQDAKYKRQLEKELALHVSKQGLS